MSNVRFALAMSLDGYIGGLGDEGWTMHDRLLGWVHDLAAWREIAGLEGGLENADSAALKHGTANVGAYVMGHTMFSFGEVPWGANPPFHAPVFVLTHHPRQTIQKEGGTTYHFVNDGIESAVRQAKAAAGDKDVRLEGGASVANQALKAGLVDEFELHLVPVLLGGGVRLFEQVGPEWIELERANIVAESQLTHLRFRVKK